MYIVYFTVCIHTALWNSSEMFLCVHIHLCMPVLSQCVFLYAVYAPPQPNSHLHAHISACCTCLHINPAHCLYMLFACAFHQKVGVPLFLLKVLAYKSSMALTIFSQKHFHTVSWAITVIAIIIGI